MTSMLKITLALVAQTFYVDIYELIFLYFLIFLQMKRFFEICFF